MIENLYVDIGAKIKKWAIWIFIVESIGAIIAGISMMVAARDIDSPSFILGVLSIIVGPIVALVSSWLLYAFGQLVDDTHAIRSQSTTINNIDKNLQTMAQPMIDEVDGKAKREAEEKARHQAEAIAKREDEEKRKRQAEAIAKHETQKQAEQIIQKKEKTLSEKLVYALMFQSDDGMVSYLKSIQDENVQNILKSPQHLIREQIKNLLENM